MPTGPAPTQPAITSGTEGSPVASGTPVASTTSLLEANSAVKRDTGLGAAFVAFVVAAILQMRYDVDIKYHDALFMDIHEF